MRSESVENFELYPFLPFVGSCKISNTLLVERSRWFKPRKNCPETKRENKGDILDITIVLGLKGLQLSYSKVLKKRRNTNVVVKGHKSYRNKF